MIIKYLLHMCKKPPLKAQADDYSEGQQWFIYNFGLMGPGTRYIQYQWVPTAN